MTYETLDGKTHSNLKKVSTDTVIRVYRGKFAKIAPEYSTLHNLTTLEIEDRQHKKTPTADIYKLPPGITKLYLSAIGFIDIGLFYEHLTRLEQIELHYIPNPIHDNMRHLYNLRELKLDYTRVPELAECLAMCQCLESITLNDIDGSIDLSPAFKNGGLPLLKRIHVHVNGGAKCVIRCPDDISHCTQLEAVNISCNTVVKCYLPTKTDGISLKQFAINYGQWRDTPGYMQIMNPQMLTNYTLMQSMEMLNLNHLLIDNPIVLDVNSLCNLKKLTITEYTNTQKRDQYFGTKYNSYKPEDVNITLNNPNFANNPVLESISLAGQCARQFGGIPESLGACQNLTTIKIDYFGHIKIPDCIAKLPKLMEITVQYAHLITEMPEPSEWVNLGEDGTINTYIFSSVLSGGCTGTRIPEAYVNSYNGCVCKNPATYKCYVKSHGYHYDNIACVLKLCTCDDASEFGLRDPTTGELFISRADLTDYPDLTQAEFDEKYIKLIRYLNSLPFIPSSMVFKTILNTTSQVPIYHPIRVVLNLVLDGTLIILCLACAARMFVGAKLQPLEAH